MSSHRARVPNQLLMFPAKRSKTNRPPALRVITHGVAIERQGRCEWMWVALGRFDMEIASQHGNTGGEYGLTSNSAKFHAVIEALRWLAEKMPDEKAKVFCDVDFIVKLINGQNKAGKLHLKNLTQLARDLLAKTNASVEWMPSSQNVLQPELSAQGIINPYRW